MSVYEVLVTISLITWILISGGLIVALLILTPKLMRTLRQLDERHLLLTERTMPVLENTDRVLDQIGQISSALVADVEVIDRAVIRAAESVERTVELVEERVSDINALVEVAVEEAEDTFFSTAALLRALRLGGRKKKRRRLIGGERRRFG